MAAMVRDQPEAEEDLPEMDRDLRDSDPGTVVQYIKFDIIGKDKGYGCDQRIHYHKKPVKDFLVVFYHMGHPICKSEKLLFNDFILQ
jgi:hypothetical protein